MSQNGDKIFAEGTIFDGETNTPIFALKVDDYRPMYMRSIR